MSIVSISGRKKRLIELSKRVAEDSAAPDYRHGAVLVKGGSVLSVATNKNSHARFGKKFRKRDCGHATHHAELGCILGLDRSATRGSDLYVVRIGKGGELRMSKPCEMCEQVLRHVGVKRVYYSISENKLGCVRL
tara:strand:+ start:1676 stop:2080 length:405 start_codon:yes stop_codon:yes gene_type:complete